MNHRIFQLSNEIEWLEVISVLESNSIPYSTSEKKNSSFPVLDLSSNQYRIAIPESFTGKFNEIIGSGYQNELVKSDDGATKSKSKSKVWTYLLIGYAVLMTLLFVKYYAIWSRSADDKNFTYRWNIQGTKLDMINKETKRIQSRFTDSNFDLNYEKFETFHNGRLVTISIDRDENGVYEESLFFSNNGADAGYSKGVNQDGLIDTLVIVLDGGRIQTLVDVDKDGLLEVLE